VEPIDALAGERHFVDHLVPLWAALPAELRGRFMVTADLLEHARRLGLAPELYRETPDRPIVVASYGDVRRVRRIGRRRIALLQHGIGQSYAGEANAAATGASYSGGADNDDVGLFLCPNEHSAARWRATYPTAEVAIVGSPKLDGLPRRDPAADPGPVVAFGFHWDCRVVPETRSGFHQFRPAIAAAARRWTVLGHGHPRLLDRSASGAVRLYRQLGVEVVTDFADVLRRADVYVFDNSSSGYEFAATRRPVVVLDATAYRRSVDHGLRFWEAADVGVRTAHASQVVGAIGEALRDPPARAAAREAALELVYAHRSGAAARAADAVTAWARTAIARQPAPRDERTRLRMARIAGRRPSDPRWTFTSGEVLARG